MDYENVLPPITGDGETSFSAPRENGIAGEYPCNGKSYGFSGHNLYMIVFKLKIAVTLCRFFWI